MIFSLNRFFSSRFFQGRSGFTLVELVVVVFIFGVVLLIAVPHINNVLDESHYYKCMSRLEQIRRAKTAYVIDHPLSPRVIPVDQRAVFRAYFPEYMRDFTCPRNSLVEYTDVYDLYSVSICTHCLYNRPEGAKDRMPVVLD